MDKANKRTNGIWEFVWIDRFSMRNGKKDQVSESNVALFCSSFWYPDCMTGFCHVVFGLHCMPMLYVCLIQNRSIIYCYIPVCSIFSRIWCSSPTSNSSTLWLIPTEISENFARYDTAIQRPSVNLSFQQLAN